MWVRVVRSEGKEPQKTLDREGHSQGQVQGTTPMANVEDYIVGS